MNLSARVLVNEIFLEKTKFKILSLNSMIFNGQIISLEFSYKFANDFVYRDKKPFFFNEIQGISSNYEVAKDDFLTEMTVNYSDEAIIQITLKTEKNSTHKINGSGTSNKSETIDISPDKHLIIFPFYMNPKGKDRLLYDLLFFDSFKSIFLL